MNTPTSVKTAYTSGFQTRLFVSTGPCWGLFATVLFSSSLLLLATLLQPRIALPVGTSPRMLITLLLLGKYSNIPLDWRELDIAELSYRLDGLNARLTEGELHLRGENGEIPLDPLPTPSTGEP